MPIFLRNLGFLMYLSGSEVYLSWRLLAHRLSLGRDGHVPQCRWLIGVVCKLHLHHRFSDEPLMLVLTSL